MLNTCEHFANNHLNTREQSQVSDNNIEQVHTDIGHEQKTFLLNSLKNIIEIKLIGF